MPKVNFAYIRQNPVLFGAIFLVFGLLLWVFINRGSGGGSTVMVGTAPPSDAAIAAGVQLQGMQISAARDQALGAMQLEAISRTGDRDFALANLEMTYGLAELAANERISDKTLMASLEALRVNSATQLGMVEENNDFMIGYAKVAADAATNQVLIGAALQRDLGLQQLDAFKTATAASMHNAELSAVGMLKKKHRPYALAGVVGYTPPPQSSGGGGILSTLAGVLSPAAALIK